MARDVLVGAPTKGLSIVRPPGQLESDECARAENVLFTRYSVRRRNGKKSAYTSPIAGSSRVTALKRFYDLATTGSVTKKLLIATDNTTTPLYCPNSDWSDDTASAVSAFTQQKLPNTSDNSLYFKDSAGYSAGPITNTQVWRELVQSNSWLYGCPRFPASGNTGDKTKDVPIRTQCDGKTYLHGLVPPNPLVIADTQGDATTAATIARYAWATPETAVNVAAYCRIATFGDLVYVVYYDSAATDLKLATRSAAGTWTLSVIDAGGILTAIPYFGFDVDSQGNLHVAYAENDATADLKYASRRADSTTWTVESVEAAGVGAGASYVSLDVDASDNPHIVYKWITAAAVTEVHYATRAGATTWTTEVADNVTSANCGDFCDIAVASTGDVHIYYRDTTNQDARYAKRTGGAWGTRENIFATGTSGAWGRIALLSTNVPVVVFSGGGAADIRYGDRTTGSWVTSQVFATASNGYGLAIDSADNPYVSYPASNKMVVAKRVSGTWGATTPSTSFGSSSAGVSDLAVDGDGTVHLVFTDNVTQSIAYEVGDPRDYFYKLTAEYDSAVLGESGPSAALGVSLTHDIDGSNTHTLDLNVPASGGLRYNMTADVTALFIYRTLKGSGSTGTYYRVGRQSCTAGVPDAVFVDNVSDADLVSGIILDTDKALPPRYKSLAFWKDRMVLANLECRDTSDSTQLDYENGGIHKNRLRFSDAFHPDLYRQNFRQDVVPDGNSGSIQRVIVNPSTDLLYVVMENDVVALVGTPVGSLVSDLSFPPRNIASATGTPAPMSVIHYGGFIFYVSKTGIEMIDGLTGRNISSDTVGSLWNQLDTAHPRYSDRINMSQMDLICAGAHVDVSGERIFWFYPSGTQSINDKALVLHFGVWKSRGFRGDPPYSIYTGWTVASCETWNGEGDRGEFFGGESNTTFRAQTYRLEFDNEDDTGGIGGSVTVTAINPAAVYPGLVDGRRPDLLKAWRSTRVFGSSGATSLAVTLDVDGGKQVTLIDTISWAATTDRQYLRNLPHTAIGVKAGLRLVATDSLSASNGPAPFELFNYAFTVHDLPAGARGSG